MSKFAVIQAGVVSNIIMWDGEDSTFTKAIDGGLIAIPTGTLAGIGWSYDGKTFTPPPEPEKTQEQLIQEVVLKKEGLIAAANNYMNSKQWPGKAVLERLTVTEKEQYNLWLDYLDVLEAVDTSSAPDINWPDPPVL
ncbi:tail fiber assembly protein [Escherichia coli]|uniref:tail fiber assembly protein n=1 Tax=Escherichia coli TaxID=562 RepID=UPI00226F5F49|nr:tail fiber assembly protein [Escherichia coli]MCX9322017.1 tail fiber assembly protein [Escherichia coli]